MTQKENSKLKLLPWNWFSSTNIEIILPKYSEKDEIEEIFNLINQYSEKVKENKTKLINMENLLKDKINTNEKSLNLNTLFKIKEKIQSLEKKGHVEKDILTLINDSIHDTGVILAMKNKLSNIEIVNFVEKDVYYFIEKYDGHSKRNPKVFEYFNIHDDKKSGFDKFVELKLHSKFKKNSKSFYKIFIEKLITLNDLNILFYLFPKKELDGEFINLLLEKMPKIFELGNNIDKNKLNENMYIIISIMVENNIQIKKFTNIVENLQFLDQNLVKEIYIYILSRNDKKITIKVIDEFSKFFINNLKNINAESIYFIIKSCSNNIDFLLKIFNSIKNYAINLEDIYNPVKTPNFELYGLFVKNGYTNNEKYFQTEYFSSISNNNIFLNIKNFEISYKRISDLIDNHAECFKSKLQLFFDNENDMFNEICDKVKICQTKIIELQNIENYLRAFEPKNKADLISRITNIVNSLKEKNICDILKEHETQGIDNYNNLVEKSKN